MDEKPVTSAAMVEQVMRERGIDRDDVEAVFVAPSSRYAWSMSRMSRKMERRTCL